MSITTIDGFTTTYASIPYYRTVWELNQVALQLDSSIPYMFRNLNEDIQSYHPDNGHSHTLNDINWTETQVGTYWYQLYKDRRVGLKTTIDVDTGKTNQITRSNDFQRLQNLLDDTVKANAPKYWAMLEAFLAEYDPIDNYSMIEESLDVRNQGTENKANRGTVTLTQTGTDSLAQTGTDTMDKTGTDSLVQTGTDTMDKSGADTLVQTGTDTMDKSGSDSLVQAGTNTIDKSGADSLVQTGTDKIDSSSSGNTSSQSNGSESGTNNTTTTNSVAPYENQTFLDHDKSIVDQDTTGTTSNTTSGTSSDTTSSTETKNLTDTQNYGSQEQETKNLTDTQNYGSKEQQTKNLTDTQNYGSKEQQTKNLTNTQNYGSKEQQTKNLTNTQTKDLTDTTTNNLNETVSYDTVGSKSITLDDTFSWDGSDINQHGLRRKGNIGVTTSQQMLESEIALKSRNIIQEIFNDINHVILLGVWNESPIGI